jgi:hypothetical protein
MQRMLFTTVALLLGINACVAQVSTIGTTAMGLPSTPGTIVTSALNGPSPFSAVTQPGVPDTTLAPVPLASDPTIPGTVVTCSTPIVQITPGTPVVPITSLPSMTGTAATLPSTSVSQNMPSTTAALGTIRTPTVGSATGTTAPTSPLGSPSTIVCSSVPGGPPTNAAALPLSTAEIPNSPPLGAIQPAVAQLGGTSIDPTMTVVPTPNAPACAESMTMYLTTPGMMAPANATGATATPGVSSPSGC